MPNPDPELSTAASAIGAQLTALFPNGVIPHEDPRGNPIIDDEQQRMSEGITGATAAPAPAAGATAAPAPAAGATAAPAATGSTGATGSPAPAATGATGGPPAATGTAPAATGPAPTRLSEEQKDEFEKGADLKAGTAFKLIRKELQEAKAQLAARESDGPGSKADPVDAAELKQLRDKVASYEKELSVSRIEVTEDFKKNISTPLQETEEGLVGLTKKYGIDQSLLANALTTTDKAGRSDMLSEISKDWNRMDQNQFDRLLGEFDKLTAQKQKALSEAADKWTQMQAEQAKEAQIAKERFDADWSRALKDTLNNLEKDLPIFKKTGDPEVDSKIEVAKAKVQALDLSKVSNDELVTAFYKAEAYPIVAMQVAALFENQVLLEGRIAKLQGNSPGAGDGDLGDPKPAEKKFDSALDSLRVKLPGILPA